MTKVITPLLILDIDGTVRLGKQELGTYVNSPDQVVIYPAAYEQIRRWREKGGRVIGISNQAGIALGHLTMDQCLATMERTKQLCHGMIDSIWFCPHLYDDKCSCRKPRPGMIYDAIADFTLRYPREEYQRTHSLLVGDRYEDQGCAQLWGCDFKWAADWRAEI
jgi:D-glycero-D-manno-heptose 1,7-bisphosphate phosphatase